MKKQLKGLVKFSSVLLITAFAGCSIKCKTIPESCSENYFQKTQTLQNKENYNTQTPYSINLLTATYSKFEKVLIK